MTAAGPTLADFGIATCSYKAFTPDMGTPVRTSVGAPRWPLGYALTEKIEAFMPAGGLRFIDDLATFTAAYRARLEEHLADIVIDITAVVVNTGKRPVLLCYEDVHVDPANHWCHRRVAAAWLEERTGLVVPELSTPGPNAGTKPKGTPKARAARPAPTSPQLTLGGSVDTDLRGGRER